MPTKRNSLVDRVSRIGTCSYEFCQREKFWFSDIVEAAQTARNDANSCGSDNSSELVTVRILSPSLPVD